MSYLKIKRLIDIVISFLGLVMLSPVYLILIIAIKIDSIGPVLYRQRRVGIHETRFTKLKFRIMKVDTPRGIQTHLLENPDQYITRVGKFLRKTSLDKLPQFINILKGEMSIIGPRPARSNQYDLINSRDMNGANGIRPGITGWAQINDMDIATIEDEARFDGEYVEKIGFLMDVRCFFGAIISLLKRDWAKKYEGMDK
ncbi:MAG: sugar transferase [Sedimentibacter sp.]